MATSGHPDKTIVPAHSDAISHSTPLVANQLYRCSQPLLNAVALVVSVLKSHTIGERPEGNACAER